MKFVVVPELKGRWIWEFRSEDGASIARSPESFSGKDQAVAAIKAVRRAASKAGVYDLVGARLDEES